MQSVLAVDSSGNASCASAPVLLQHPGAVYDVVASLSASDPLTEIGVSWRYTPLGAAAAASDSPTAFAIAERLRQVCPS